MSEICGVSEETMTVKWKSVIISVLMSVFREKWKMSVQPTFKSFSVRVVFDTIEANG